MMTRIYNDTVHVPGNTKAGSDCRARVWTNGTGFVVLLSEAEHNPGFSVTNAFEQFATELWKECPALATARPELVRWFEHYPERLRAGNMAATFDRVELRQTGTVFHSPQWRSSSLAELEALIKTQLKEQDDQT